ncbi:hypothetical protein QMK19_23220 [Streptomyces sp. H10-C2]|nr:hypothetical protein [Streptomyces sp. H10-C2]
MGIVSTRKLRKRLAGLPLPDPFTIDGLVANMAAISGRRIELVEITDRDTDLRTACGLRARTADTTFILHRQRPTEHQTQHTQLHELAHEWFSHGTNLSAAELRALVPAHLRDGLIQRLGPDAVIQARARYDTVDERDAELSASLIARAARQGVSGGQDLVSLLETSLSHPIAPLRRRH